jgi:hypothetical protein
MEVNERLERLRRRAELERRLSSAPAPARAGREAAGMDDDEPRSAAPPATVLLVDPDAAAAAPGNGWGRAVLSVPVPATPLDAVTASAGPGDVVARSHAAPPAAGVPQDGGQEEVLRVVHDILPTLQPVLQDHPGVTVGIWPPGTPVTDVEAALRLSVDPVTGLTVLVPPRAGGGAGAAAPGGPGQVPPPAAAPEPADVPSVARQLAGLLRGEPLPGAFESGMPDSSGGFDQTPG